MLALKMEIQQFQESLTDAVQAHGLYAKNAVDIMKDHTNFKDADSFPSLPVNQVRKLPAAATDGPPCIYHHHRRGGYERLDRGQTITRRNGDCNHYDTGAGTAVQHEGGEGPWRLLLRTDQYQGQ